MITRNTQSSTISHRHRHSAANRDSAPFDVVVESDGTGSLVFVEGELDLATAPALRDIVGALVDSCSHIIVDFAELRFIDSSGLSALVALHSQSTAAGVRFALRNPPPMVRRVLALTGIDHLIPTEGP